MRHTATKAVFEQWQRLRGERRAPDRLSLNPAEFGTNLADIFLLEKSDGAVRFRIAGTRICGLFGEELRGMPFAALFSHDSSADIAEMVATALDDENAVIAGVSALFDDRTSIAGELLLLPLTHETGGHGEKRLLGVMTTRGHRPLAQSPCTAIDVISFRIVDVDDMPGSADSSDTRSGSRRTDPALLRRARFRVYEGGI